MGSRTRTLGVRRLVRWLAVAGLALFVAGCQPETPLEVFGQSPAFELVDQQSSPFGSSDLQGRAVVMDFIYTNCTDACPLLSAKMAQVQQKVRADQSLGNRVLSVSVSVDPLHDTPPVLTEYGGRFHADPATWKFLTGNWDDVYDLVTGLKVASRAPRPPADAPPPGGTEITHSTRVVVLDPQGQIRAYLRGDEVSPDEVVATVKKVLR